MFIKYAWADRIFTWNSAKHFVEDISYRIKILLWLQGVSYAVEFAICQQGIVMLMVVFVMFKANALHKAVCHKSPSCGNILYHLIIDHIADDQAHLCDGHCST